MLHDMQFYVENPDLFDALDEEQKELVFKGQAIDVDGDTGAAEDEGDAKPDTEEATETSDTPDASQQVEEPPVVLTKDGRHTIPYSELEAARNKAAEWEAFARHQQQMLAELQQAKQDDAGTGETSAQDAVLEKYEGIYPEIAQDMAPLVQTMIEQGIKNGLAAFEQQLNQRLAPVEETVKQSATDRLIQEVRAAHPNFEKDVESNEFKDWWAKQPSFMQSAMREAWMNENPADKVALLDTFYASRPKPAEVEKPAGRDVDTVISAAKKPAPASLTDVPAGMATGFDDVESIVNASPAALVNKFSSMTPEQVNKVLSRVLS